MSIFKSIRPIKWLRNMKKYGIKISGGRTELIRTKKGNYVQRYKRTIKKWR